jgi:hypothetical protein
VEDAVAVGSAPREEDAPRVRHPPRVGGRVAVRARQRPEGRARRRLLLAVGDLTGIGGQLAPPPLFLLVRAALLLGLLDVPDREEAACGRRVAPHEEAGPVGRDLRRARPAQRLPGFALDQALAAQPLLLGDGARVISARKRS